MRTLSELWARVRWYAGLVHDRARERLAGPPADTAATAFDAPAPAVVTVNAGGGRLWLVWVGLALAGLWIASIYWARWDMAHERDQWWRDEIARKSAAGTTILKKADRDLPAADRDAIAKLESENAALAAEIRDLKNRRDEIPLSDPCGQCRVPADRLRAR